MYFDLIYYFHNILFIFFLFKTIFAISQTIHLSFFTFASHSLKYLKEMLIKGRKKRNSKMNTKQKDDDLSEKSGRQVLEINDH